MIVDPRSTRARPARLINWMPAAGGMFLLTLVATAGAAPRHDRPTDPAAGVAGCEKVQAPAGTKLSFRSYATGVQIYQWSGTAWTFVGPSAVLHADAKGKSTVGIHFSGPTWMSNSGSKVVAAVVERCTPDANAIPWLLLGAVTAEGPGIFRGTTFIQRVNTVGGNAPAAPGSFTGDVVRVPYTAEYLFYRAE